jgi:hypothetical protein
MNNNLTKKLELILRVAVSMTFLGHGMVALGGSVKWLVYLETAGFSIESAKDVILMIGGLDLVVAALVLFKPYKYVVLWAVIWAFSTALIRPISGESIWAFIERGANWGAPLALFFLLNNKKK